MNFLPVTVALPHLKNDMTIARAQMAASGAMPSSKGLENNLVTEMQLCFIDFLITNKDDKTTFQFRTPSEGSVDAELSSPLMMLIL